ncbi:uncharacterized protein LACBIDRAFT_304155 [Laccaria bicolor S238N-H82]|uniref:Predicted protein n=1 Tax=Laccaria bicolor (strain S238N-H82 / ATCC MYA-4686) TaxID=486041 RepID=B0DL29_LACBS|nr:uncharacterized protein LACBIDRAFT_304155 [Laccaria bicolor S238N-H82]EDR04754.1 predicted protein [Laccaria bicolor S238N-H82]|eukprot:XP_001884578.1 predicted protein [Laccaria bicolor S238N-H82]
MCPAILSPRAPASRRSGKSSLQKTLPEMDLHSPLKFTKWKPHPFKSQLCRQTESLSRN